jgi:hypothetical protein
MKPGKESLPRHRVADSSAKHSCCTSAGSIAGAPPGPEDHHLFKLAVMIDAGDIHARVGHEIVDGGGQPAVQPSRVDRRLDRLIDPGQTSQLRQPAFLKADEGVCLQPPSDDRRESREQFNRPRIPRGICFGRKAKDRARHVDQRQRLRITVPDSVIRGRRPARIHRHDHEVTRTSLLERVR